MKCLLLQKRSSESATHQLSQTTDEVTRNNLLILYTFNVFCDKLLFIHSTTRKSRKYNFIKKCRSFFAQLFFRYYPNL